MLDKTNTAPCGSRIVEVWAPGELEAYEQRQRDRVYGRGEYANGVTYIDLTKPDHPSWPIDAEPREGDSGTYANINHPESEGAGL